MYELQHVIHVEHLTITSKVAPSHQFYNELHTCHVEAMVKYLLWKKKKKNKQKSQLQYCFVKLVERCHFEKIVKFHIAEIVLCCTKFVVKSMCSACKTVYCGNIHERPLGCPFLAKKYILSAFADAVSGQHSLICSSCHLTISEIWLIKYEQFIMHI